MPPHTTERRTTNLTNNNQNCQKIELYVSLTTKKLKKKHSSRLVGGAETGSWGGEDLQQSRRNPGGTTEEQNISCKPRVPLWGNKPQTSYCKNLWELPQQEKLPASQETSLERPTGS